MHCAVHRNMVCMNTISPVCTSSTVLYCTVLYCTVHMHAVERTVQYAHEYVHVHVYTCT